MAALCIWTLAYVIRSDYINGHFDYIEGQLSGQARKTAAQPGFCQNHTAHRKFAISLERESEQP
ncbi:hypothetical protein AAKU67_000226 [Oxalobacteraceae bacterium GrIS 2.11]